MSSPETSVYSMLKLSGFAEKLSWLKEKIYSDPRYMTLQDTEYHDLREKIFAEFPELRTKVITEDLSYADLVNSALRSMLFLRVEGEDLLLDAPFLLKRNPNDPLYAQGIEDLEEAFRDRNFTAMIEQLKNAMAVIDLSAFSVPHNIHDGFIPLYAMREAAFTLSDNAKWLNRLLHE